MLLYYMTRDGQRRSKDALGQAWRVWDKQTFAFRMLCGELEMKWYAMFEVCFHVSLWRSDGCRSVGRWTSGENNPSSKMALTKSNGTKCNFRFISGPQMNAQLHNLLSHLIHPIALASAIAVIPTFPG
jgi:hypothetical protein